MQRRQFNSLGLGGVAAWALPSGLLVAAAHSAATAQTTAQIASVGQPAPTFALSDTAGKAVKLSDFRGKPVVLEWNNPGCPFVRKHYNGNLQALHKTFTAKGVVWLAINSTRNDSPDFLSPPQLARWMTDKGAAPTATLIDQDGKVGQAYGARVTPHMYIVNAQGVLVYAGGIDSIPSAREADIAQATNYVRQGLDELLAGKPLSTPTSLPYGCSVKYKNAAA